MHNYAIYEKTISLTGHQPHTYLSKTTAYYSETKTVHIPYADIFTKKVDSNYVFDNKTYENDSSTQLYCITCNVRQYFYCSKNHNNKNRNIFVIVCTKCKKKQSYYVNPAYKIKYEKGANQPIVREGCITQADQDEILILRTRSKDSVCQYTSPISSIITPDIMEQISNLINELIQNDGHSLSQFDNYKQCRDFVDLNFTHLDPKNNNIISPNKAILGQSFGLLLSVESLLRIINRLDNGWFSDEIFIFFRNTLKFHQEYCQTTNKLNNNVPPVIFSNTHDDCCKISPFFKKQPYHIINKEFGKKLTDGDKNKNKLKIREWYQCNEKTQVDSFFKRFDLIDKTISNICVQLHEDVHWSVLDVITLHETVNSRGYVKRIVYVKPINKEDILDSVVNRLKFSSMWWAKFFGLYAKEKSDVAHSDLYFGSDYMSILPNHQ